MIINRRALLASLAATAGAACTPDGQGPTTSVASASSSAASAGPPAYVDPLAGLFNRPAASVPSDVPVDYYTPGSKRGKGARAVLTMAVVPGANFDMLQNYFEARSKSSFFGSSATAVDLDTGKSVRRVVEVLKERYPWIELMDDVATAQQRNVSLTLVVDIRAILATPNVAQIDVIVFDEDRKPFSRIAVEGRGGSFQDALGEALAQLNAKAKSYLT